MKHSYYVKVLDMTRRVGPVFEYDKALTTAAAEAHALLGGIYNFDVVLWEAMLLNHRSPSTLLTAEGGLAHYLELRRQVEDKVGALTSEAKEVILS